jgi:TolB-like protein/Tfp pilus assembly protein PilF
VSQPAPEGTLDVPSIFAELKRRNVIRVALLYGLAAWVILQAAGLLFGLLELPNWAGKLVLGLLLLGFPLVLLFSWIYELTPDGIKRESLIDPSEAVPGPGGRKLNIAIAALLVLTIAIVVGDRLVPDTVPTAAESASTSPPTRDRPLLPAVAGPSIAVLPFVDMSSSKDNEYFSDGLTEELLNSLAKIRALKVAGRTSSFAYKGKDVDLRVIGKALGVAHVLEGSVRKAGNQLRITAQLISAADGYHLWTETYDREMTDIFAIQSDIAEQVAKAMQVTLLGDDRARMQAGGTTDPEAHNDYLRGMYFLNLGSREESLRKAVASFEKALARDPDYAQAWIGLGGTWSWIMANAWSSVNESRPHIQRAADRARQLAPNLAGGYQLQATLLAFVDLNWAEALPMAERAMALEPANPDVLRQYAYITNNIGRHDEAIAAAKRALEIDPGLSNNRLELGVDYLWARRYAEAESVFRELIARDPEFPRARYNLGVCRYLQGDSAGALELFEQEPLEWMNQTGRALALRALGRRHDADAAFGELVQISGKSASYQQAQVAAQWGDADLAFKMLDQALKVQDLGASRLLIDPLLDPIRTDSRFRKAVERAGLLPFMQKDAAAGT